MTIQTTTMPERWSHCAGQDAHGIGKGFVNALILSAGRCPIGAKAYEVRTGGTVAYVQADTLDKAQRVVELIIQPACDAWVIRLIDDRSHAWPVNQADEE